MQSLVFDSYIKESVVLEPGSKVVGVIIPQNRYVTAGKIITNQEEVELLPEISPQFQYYDFNKKVVSINFDLTKGYKRFKK